MKNILLLILALNTSMSFAKSKKQLMTYDEYIVSYGTNDTSKAIIEIFFNKRENVAIAKMSFLPTSSLVTIVVPPIGFALMGVSSPLFVSGLITKSNYSHNKLKKELAKYKSTGVLSKRRKKQIKHMFDKHKVDEKIKLNQSYMNVLRSVDNSQTLSLNK